MPFLFKVSGLDLGKELALIEEGVLGSTAKPRSSSLLSVDFDLLCLKQSGLLSLEPDKVRGRISFGSKATISLRLCSIMHGQGFFKLQVSASLCLRKFILNKKRNVSKINTMLMHLDAEAINYSDQSDLSQSLTKVRLLI